jgi:monovalent cation:H+ antiporter-2, CPA2 family
VAAVTMCLIPLLASWGAAARKAQKAISSPVSEDDLVAEAARANEAHVIVAGYGRVGEVAVDLLETHKIPYLAVDADIDRVRAARKLGRQVYVGDASRGEFLRACGIDHARTLVVTMDGGASVDDVVIAAHLERPDLPIVARARDAAHAIHLYSLGVREAVPETLEASLQVGEALLVEAGVAMGHILVSIHDKRAQMRDELLQAYSATTPSERLRVLRARHAREPDVG